MPLTYKLVTGCRFCHSILAGGSKSAELFSVRNSWAAFQIAFDADEPYALNLDKNMYISQMGKIPTLRVSCTAPFSVEMCLIDTHTDDDLLKKGDALLTITARDYEKGGAAIWVEFKIPADVQPGEYHFTLCIHSHVMLQKSSKTGSRFIFNW